MTVEQQVHKAIYETRADECGRIADWLKEFGCNCPHSRMWASEEWDRRHTNWCTVKLEDSVRGRRENWLARAKELSSAPTPTVST